MNLTENDLIDPADAELTEASQSGVPFSEDEFEEDVERSPELEAMQHAYITMQDERDQIRDQLIRTMADFQNFRKRSEADKASLRQFATEKLVVDLLPVLDNFERTVVALQKGSSMESVLGGIQAVERQLRTVLESHNVSRIPAVGEPFDPEVHEAVATDETDEHPNDTVLHELEPGYRIAERVIRPARVRVSKKP